MERQIPNQTRTTLYTKINHWYYFSTYGINILLSGSMITRLRTQQLKTAEVICIIRLHKKSKVCPNKTVIQRQQ